MLSLWAHLIPPGRQARGGEWEETTAPPLLVTEAVGGHPDAPNKEEGADGVHDQGHLQSMDMI